MAPALRPAKPDRADPGVTIQHPFIDGLAIRENSLLGVLLPDQKLMLIEANDIEERQRFTVAHECGHLILDYKDSASPSLFEQSSDSVFSCDVSDLSSKTPSEPWRRRREILANKFAANLLMPASLCKEIFRKEPTVEACALKLRVSKEACRIRLRELGLIQALQAL
ncbi:MAG TPA: ImmA/IrrE family metallo-endopeptidase [Candidatus Rubrimentiphilum sp.]|nr:ImmA/IrrE family metallo-endopeptidase [Candidatus Rubrimentiphilum sp.]